VTVFRVDQHTGAPEFTGQYLPVGSPTMIVFPPG
jgi:6-phosphogluconolactonase